ncbi:hypothetical protein HMPREF1982_04426 [Clostridiales bacterium oral taxon 876 str. F0540]|nr:hypothetical protein HMPREF1982_04426 [Clostridiales bacterium oral taxon 876 str. F0540]
MFFIGGVSTKEEKLDFSQTVVCPECGSYGRYEVYMEYMYLSLFFIPAFKWNRKYYVVSSCCGSVYLIYNTLAERVAKGDRITLTEQDLHLVRRGHSFYLRKCINCGFETQEDYKYCPTCSAPLK